MKNQKQKIGFIGLGVMGKPMALNLIKAGYSLMVHDISPGPVRELIDAGARQGTSPAHIGEQCDVIFTMLPDSPQVAEVIAGKGGVLEGYQAG